MNRRRLLALLIKNQEFNCTDCTACCKFRVSLSKEDIARIKTKKEYVEEEKGKKYIKRVNGYCIFMNIKEGKSSCSIYEMRPKICREFPKIKCCGFDTYDPRCEAFKIPKFLKKL